MRPKRLERRVTIHCHPDMEAAIREAAEAQMTTAADYARRALAERLSKDGFIPARAAAKEAA